MPEKSMFFAHGQRAAKDVPAAVLFDRN